MSTHSYISIQFLLIILVGSYSLWFVFFLLNKGSSINKSAPAQAILVKNTLPEGPYNELLMVRFSTIILGTASLIALLTRSISGSFFYNQLDLTPHSYSIVVLVLSLYTALLCVLGSLLVHNRGITFDYLFTVSNLFLLAPLLYLSSNLFSFFFLLEVLSVLVFLKFTSLQMVKSLGSSTAVKNSTGAVNPMPEKHIITLFTQYWVSFFSSILFVFFILISLFLCNTTKYLELDILLIHILGGSNGASSIFLLFWDFFFILGFFLKSGLSPMHSFKIDIYRGIPLLSTFIYTFIYFINFFMYFVFLIVYTMSHIKLFSGIFLQIFLIVSFIYLTTSLFTNKYTKSFLALSSVINSLLFLTLGLSTPN